MNSASIKFLDIQRMLIGEVPWIFLLEVVIRILFIYLLLVVSMRLMGKRMAGTVNRNELAALVSMAAAIGIPMQQPDKGLIPAVIIAGIVVSIQRLLAMWGYRHKKAEDIIEGDLSIMVEDGTLNLKNMEKSGFSKERIFAQLRSEGISNLGSVERLYLESNGGFSILESDSSQPGLSILPEWDTEFRETQEKLKDALVCDNCGKKTEIMHQVADPCSKCNNVSKAKAVL